jgi:biotin operon repressor
MVAVAAERQARSARRLNDVALHAPIDAVEAAAQALGTLVQHQERSAFVTWVLRTLVENEITDLEELVAVLGRPEILADVRRRDPLAAARLRSLRAKKQMLEAEGGVVSGRELAQALGITRQAVDKRRLAGKLIGIDLGKRGYAYPVWQIGLNGMEAVLAELAELDPWTQALFMLSASSWLNGETPLAALRRGELDEVLNAARLYGEQTAA